MLPPCLELNLTFSSPYLGVHLEIIIIGRGICSLIYFILFCKSTIQRGQRDQLKIAQAKCFVDFSAKRAHPKLRY